MCIVTRVSTPWFLGDFLGGLSVLVQNSDAIGCLSLLTKSQGCLCECMHKCPQVAEAVMEQPPVAQFVQHQQPPLNAFVSVDNR